MDVKQSNKLLQPPGSTIFPPLESYSDVNINSRALLPPVTRQNSQIYLDRFGKRLSDALRLYESRYLLALRCAQSGVDTFLKGLCKSSRKGIHYEINIKISQSGVPEEANCSCVAGEGTEAHCKHVKVVLVAVSYLIDKEFLLFDNIYRSNMKAWPKPAKKFKRLPLKVEELYSKRDIKRFHFSPFLKHNPDFDKKAYQSRFRSLILNFPSSSMPLKQLYLPGNPYAVRLDHSYTEKDSEAEA